MSDRQYQRIVASFIRRLSAPPERYEHLETDEQREYRLSKARQEYRGGTVAASSHEFFGRGE